MFYPTESLCYRGSLAEKVEVGVDPSLPARLHLKKEAQAYQHPSHTGVLGKKHTQGDAITAFPLFSDFYFSHLSILKLPLHFGH